MSITMESASIGGDLSEVVQEPRLSTVRQGINNLVNRVFEENTHVPAQIDFSYQEVHSISQMNMFVGVDVSYGAGDLESSFEWDQHEETTKIVAKYQQIYYSIDLDTPDSPVDLFAADVSAAQLETALPAGYVFEAPVSRTVTFDTENCDWECARLSFDGNARDWDPAENDEWSSGNLELLGNSMSGEKRPRSFDSECDQRYSRLTPLQVVGSAATASSTMMRASSQRTGWPELPKTSNPYRNPVARRLPVRS